MSRLLSIGMALGVMLWMGLGADVAHAQIDSGQRICDPAGGSSSSSTDQSSLINTGAKVVVKADDVKMMRGEHVVGRVPNGQQFEVTAVINGWLGTVVEVDGKKLNGWVRQEQVVLKEAATGTSPQVAGGNAPAESYRRFSYQPSQPYRAYQPYEPPKDPWQYPKTDPRRYRPRGQ